MCVLTTGCGSHERGLGNGDWYGKLVSVDAAKRTLTFVPACRSVGSTMVRARASMRHETVIAVARNPSLMIYFRPDGDPAQGHGQAVRLAELAGDLPARLPDSPPGWYLAVRDGATTWVEEDSGIYPSGGAERRRLGCVLSPGARSLVAG